MVEMSKALSQSSPKAPGPLKVPMRLIKILATKSESFKEILLDLMNGLLSLKGKSSISKESELTLLKKNHNLATLANLRPITIMPTLSKLLAKLLATRLSTLLHEYALLHWCQQGFLKGTRCETAMAAIIDITKHAFEHNKPLYLMFYDLRAAFDRVDLEGA
jgi:hypothetical protein